MRLLHLPIAFSHLATSVYTEFLFHRMHADDHWCSNPYVDNMMRVGQVVVSDHPPFVWLDIMA